MACRKQGCVWQGVLGAYASHTCPKNVNEIADIARLQDLINFDERMYIKVDGLRKIGQELIGCDGRVGHIEYLGMVCTYMQRYIGFLEICTVCMDILEAVVQLPMGKAAMIGCGTELVTVLSEMTEYEELGDRVVKLMTELSTTGNDGVLTALIALKKGKSVS